MMSVSSFKAQARFHFWGILLSIVVSLIVGLPAIIFHFSSDYHGIDMLKTNAEDFYVSEIQEVYDGHPGLGNASFADQKSSLYLFPPFSPNLIATIGRIIGVNAVGAVLATRFIFAFIISLLVYLFAWQLTGRRAVGLVAAAGITLAYNLTDPSNFRSFLFHFYTDNPKIGFLGYGRPINPSVSSLLFFAYLNCFWMYLYRSGKRVWGVASAVILGVSFYSYLFTWLFIFSFNGFLFAIYTFKKDLVMIKKILAVSLGGVILGIPYAFHIFEVMHSPWYGEVSPRFGFLPVRAANISRIVLGAFALFLVSIRLWKKNDSARIFWWAFFLTAVFVANEQVITGRFVFNHHFHWYYNTPLVVLFVSSWLFLLAGKMVKKQYLINVLTVLLILTCVMSGIARERMAYHVAAPIVVEEQRYAPLMHWLNESTPKDSTIFTSPSISSFITAFTHNNVYYNSNALYTLVPNDRLLYSYAIRTYLENIPVGDARSYFESNRGEISNMVFGNQYHLTPGVCLGCFPDSVIDRLVGIYTTLSDKTFLRAVSLYPVDYFVWDKKNNPAWRLDRFELPVVASFGDFTVYSFEQK